MIELQNHIKEVTSENEMLRKMIIGIKKDVIARDGDIRKQKTQIQKLEKILKIHARISKMKLPQEDHEDHEEHQAHRPTLNRSLSKSNRNVNVQDNSGHEETINLPDTYRENVHYTGHNKTKEYYSKTPNLKILKIDSKKAGTNAYVRTLDNVLEIELKICK
jgi:hypothetical protein